MLLNKFLLNFYLFSKTVFKKSRLEILKVHTKSIPLAKSLKKDLKFLSEITENFSGADLENLCREAVLACLREDFTNRTVYKKHFLSALEKVSPSVDPQLQRFYQNFASEIKSKGFSPTSTKDKLTYG